MYVLRQESLWNEVSGIGKVQFTTSIQSSEVHGVSITIQSGQYSHSLTVPSAYPVPLETQATILTECLKLQIKAVNVFHKINDDDMATLLNFAIIHPKGTKIMMLLKMNEIMAQVISKIESIF